MKRYRQINGKLVDMGHTHSGKSGTMQVGDIPDMLLDVAERKVARNGAFKSQRKRDLIRQYHKLQGNT